MKLSVITPSYGQLDWLRLSVASVRDQISSAFEVEHIIQDAGSPGIEEFAREVGAEFYRDGVLVSTAHARPAETGYRITIYCEADKGMYDAINRGLARSGGEICAWLNSDEQYLSHILARVVQIFSTSPDLDVLLGDALLTDGDHRPVSYRRIMVPSRWHTRLDHLHSLSCAMFFRRRALPDPPLDPTRRIISDAILMDHFLGSGKRILSCREVLSTYAFTGVNLSAQATQTEHASWLKELALPPAWLRWPVVLIHRVRRLLHGAYGRFPIDSGIYTRDSLEKRVPIRGTVSGRWPKSP